MRWDIKVAAHFYVAAAFLAVCVMAAPVAFHIEGQLSVILFWMSFAGAAVFTFAGFRAGLRGEAQASRRGHLRRMIGLYAMLVCGIGFIALAATFFWPNQGEQDAGVAEKAASFIADHAPPTFRQVFDADLSTSGGSFGTELVIVKPGGLKQYSIPVRVLWDDNAQTKFLAVFVPINTEGIAVYTWVLHDLKKILTILNTVVASSRTPGDTAEVSSSNFMFTNVIYFYMEDDLNLTEQSELEKAFLDRGIRVQFRGHAYYSLRAQDAAFVANLKASIKAQRSAPLPTPALPAPPAGTSPQTSP